MKQATAERPHKKKKRKKASIDEMIRAEFGNRADEALRIAMCESRLDPDDVSSAGAVGVFQIRAADHDWRVKKVRKGKDLKDPRTNIRVARHIFKREGWRPWVCARILGMTRPTHRIVTTTFRSSGPRVPRRPRDGNMSW